jgi:hypothetical protein
VGPLVIIRNPMLASLEGLETLEAAESTLIMENPVLTTLRALSSLQSIEGSLSIFDNSQLATCEAEWLANSVQTITGSVALENNDDGGVCQ